MNAREIMTSPVITATPDMTIAEAAKLLAEHHIGGLPVLEGEEVVGMFTESNLLHRIESNTRRPRLSSWREWMTSNQKLATTFLQECGTKVRDAMTSSVYSVDEVTHIGDVAEILERRAIRRAPVMRNGKLVGIVSRSDLVRALAVIMQEDRKPQPTSTRDIDLRDAVVRSFDGQRWGLGPQNVLVSDGVVHVWGIVGSEEERRAIESTVEQVPGVREVESHLEFPTMFPIP